MEELIEEERIEAREREPRQQPVEFDQARPPPL